MKKKPAMRYATGLLAILKDASRNVGEGIIHQFVDGLAREGKAGLLPAILAAVEHEIKREMVYNTANVWSVRSLDEKTRAALQDTLKKEIHAHEDPGLIGGIKITTHDALIDGTIDRQLKRLLVI